MRIATLAVSATIRNDDAIRAREQWRDETPIGFTCRRRAMNQNDGRAIRIIIAKRFVVNLRAIDFDE
jgi:hypothetical protein